MSLAAIKNLWPEKFEDRPMSKGRPRNADLIRTVSLSQHQILGWIRDLYSIERFDLDLTYSKGRFYRNGIREPRFKMDIRPLEREVIKATAAEIPFKSNSLQSIVFDPPFFADGGMDSDIRYKYGAFESLDHLWDTYRAAMRESWRVLEPMGHLIFKCQDICKGRQQFMIHADIIRYAQQINFYCRDLFIKLQGHVPISWNHGRQQGARKFHCYFIVLQKKLRKVRMFQLD